VRSRINRITGKIKFNDSLLKDKLNKVRNNLSKEVNQVTRDVQRDPLAKMGKKINQLQRDNSANKVKALNQLNRDKKEALDQVRDKLRHGAFSDGASTSNVMADLKSTMNDLKLADDVLSEKSPIETLEQRRLELDKQVRDIKATGVIMETDAESLNVTGALQEITRFMIQAKYGNHKHYRVKVDLEFQSSIPDFDTNGPDGTIVIEMAPIEYIPVSVYNWLEIARTWKSGAFHRNAGHVLQATTNAGAVKKSLAFQEYSKLHPHKKGTAGYCGRPSGPCWYISIQDNTGNHGPGSQQQKNPHEADANFGRIVEGLDDVVPRIHTTPQKSWLDKNNQILIKTMTILVSEPDGTFVEWQPQSNDT